MHISVLVVLHTAFTAESENVALSLQKPAEHLQHLFTCSGAYIRWRLDIQIAVIYNCEVSNQFDLSHIYTLSTFRLV